MIDTDFIESTLRELVSINSINPAFTDGATSEAAVAARVGEICRALQMEVELLEFEPGRVSVVARLRGTGNGKSLMLNGHLDTVGVEKLSAPFDPQLRAGKLFGRGTYDMKGGITACLGALKALRDSGIELQGDVVLAAVADEETESRGMQQVIEHVRTDAAIVTEATELDICIAHKGFCWLEIETTGKAAHGSKYLEGTDANMHMGHVLHRLGMLSDELLTREHHELVGPPTLHTPLIKGGTGISTYSSDCVLQVERRTLPGETENSVVAEIEAILAQLRREVPNFRASVRSFLYRAPLETPRSAAIVIAVEEATRSTLGKAPRIIGQSYWMDAALLNHAGIETVVVGPIGHGAHALDEHVDLASVGTLAEILMQSAISYCGSAVAERGRGARSRKGLGRARG